MKRLIILIAIGAVLFALYGCGTQSPVFSVMVTPDSGHPPFSVTVTAADMSGGTYTYEATGLAAVQSTKNVFKTVVHEWPWFCAVTWNNGDKVARYTVHVGLNNIGPTIYKPLITNWYARPLERTLIDCTYREEKPLYPGYRPTITGIKDPEGDDWHLVSISVKCDLLDRNDTLFYPPYQPGIFHADGIDNAAIWYPTYGGAVNKVSELPYPPYPESGYPYDPCWTSDIPTMQPQEATITIVAEDQSGAKTSKSFRIPVGATGCSN